MKQLAMAAVVIAALLSTLLPAQSFDLRANIPFAFRVGQTQLPAGEYSIVHRGDGPTILQEANGHHAAMIAFGVGQERSSRRTTGALEFNRYGENYFLAEVWPPYSQRGVTLPKSRKETELARRFTPSQTVGIALQRK